MFLASIWWKICKVFYGLEKKNAICGTIKTLINDGKQLTMPNEINLTLKIYESLFQKDIKKSVSDIETFLTQIQLPTITDGNYAKDETDITADNLFVALKSKPDNKSPSNDGLSKGFYESLWEDIKDVFINSIKEAKIKGSLSISERQAVIKLFEKKDQDKRFIKNWRSTCSSMSIQKYYWKPFQQNLNLFCHLLFLQIGLRM